MSDRTRHADVTGPKATNSRSARGRPKSAERGPAHLEASKSAQAKAPGAGLGAHITKRQFVESLPGLSAKEVVAEAHRRGISLTAAYVYMVRGPRSATPARGRPAPLVPSSDTTDQRSLEAEFITIALELGLRRAEDLLLTVRSQIRTRR